MARLKVFEVFLQALNQNLFRWLGMIFIAAQDYVEWAVIVLVCPIFAFLADQILWDINLALPITGFEWSKASEAILPCSTPLPVLRIFGEEDWTFTKFMLMVLHTAGEFEAFAALL